MCSKRTAAILHFNQWLGELPTLNSYGRCETFCECRPAGSVRRSEFIRDCHSNTYASTLDALDFFSYVLRQHSS